MARNVHEPQAFASLSQVPRLCVRMDKEDRMRRRCLLLAVLALHADAAEPRGVSYHGHLSLRSNESALRLFRPELRLLKGAEI